MAQSKEYRFYSECLSAGLTDISTEAARARGELIAQKLGYRNIQNYDAFFKAGREQYEAVAAAEKLKASNAALAEKRNEEGKQAEEYRRYSDLYGRDKRVKMLSDKYARLLAEAKSASAGADALVRSTQQNEIDWATHGGIASGIAGGAAGLAVAMDAQAKNAVIRAQNEANLRTYAPVFTAAYSNAAGKSRAADSCAAELEEAKLKLVGKETPEELMPHLCFSSVKITGSETGAITVSARASQDNDVRIFGTLPAFIDGSLIAEIYKVGEDAPVGTAVMVFPIDGAENSPTVSGISLGGYEKGTEYTARFKPYKLWAMERYKSTYTLPANLYANGSPVIIESGTLYIKGSKEYLSLLFRGLSTKPVTSIALELSNTAKEANTKVYGGISLKWDETACVEQELSGGLSAESPVKGMTVRYEDGTTWNSDTQFASLPAQKELSYYDRCKKLDEIKLALGEDVKYVPAEYADLWFCACGARNHKEDENCLRCARSLKTLREVIDEGALIEEHEEILENDRAEAAAKAAERKKKLIKLGAIAAGAVAILAIAIGIFNWYSKKSDAYDAALALAEEAKYEEAIAAFTELGGFKDSSERVELVREMARESEYDRAMALLEAHRFDSAAYAFAAMGDYEGAAEMIPECKYQKALYILSGGIIVDYIQTTNEPSEDVAGAMPSSNGKTTEDIDYAAAYALFEELGDYKDSATYLAGFTTLLTTEVENDLTYRYYYNEEGLVAKLTYSDGGRCEYAYANGVLKSETYFAKNETKGVATLYDEHGNIIEAYGSKGRYTVEWEYYDSGAPRSFVMYDEKGKPFQRRVYEESGSYSHTNVYMKGDEEIVSSGSDVTVDEHGNIIEEISYKLSSKGERTESGYTQSFTYDERGKVIKRVRVENDEVTLGVDYEYNADGSLIKMTNYLTGIAISYEYDEEGRLLKRTSDVDGVLLERTYGLVYCPKREVK